jgi:hypothetical protein
LISTCAGAWRYLIGDTIRFTDVEESEIIITGRTKHFLSMCGEHLSVDNMNKAIMLTAQELNIEIDEYTVMGIPHHGLFAHQWYVACENEGLQDKIKEKIDGHLKVLNDDYRVERGHALKEVFVKVLPDSVFLKFLEERGKMGSQHKFPRVLKGKMLEDWQHFLQKLPNINYV